MLLGNLGDSFLGNLSIDKGTIRASEGTIRAGQDFYCLPILQLIWIYKSIIKKNLNLMVFIQETIYLKQRTGHMSYILMSTNQ